MSWEQAEEALSSHGNPAHRRAVLAADGHQGSGAGHHSQGSAKGSHSHDPGQDSDGKDGHSHIATGKCASPHEREEQGLVQNPKIGYQPATPDDCRGSALRLSALDSGDDHHVHSSAQCTPTPEQLAAADKLAADTKAALQKYLNDPLQATADGFVAFPVPTSKYFHMIDVSRFDDANVLSPEHIESFMYGMTDEGLTPIGGMYVFEPKDQQPPDPTGCLMQWHKHSMLVGRTSDDRNQVDDLQSVWMAHLYLFGDIDPWGRDSDGSEPHAWFWAYRGIPAVCNNEAFCI